jgi:hypothetical protein
MLWLSMLNGRFAEVPTEGPARPGQAALDRPDRYLQIVCDLFEREVEQVVEHDYLPLCDRQRPQRPGYRHRLFRDLGDGRRRSQAQ